VPRISMWKEKKGNDYRWIDKTIAEMFVAGGTGIALHKYLGPIDQGATGDATKPSYATQSPTNIQDILFLENRDRKYDTDVYLLRGMYQRSDNDFDLTQFGIFLQTGTVMMSFHYNEMIATVGRKIMAGDVLELMHLKDEDVDGVPAALKRYYVVGDCSWAAEGFSPTWYPHLWRCKLNPLVDSQEYKDILKNITVTNTLGPMGTSVPPTGTPLGDIMSTYNKYLNINEAIVAQADAEVPKSGYDVSKIYSFGADAAGNPALATLTADDQVDTADSPVTSDSATFSPVTSENPVGYLSGDGLAPNGLPVGAGVAFPSGAQNGDYFLRLDYLPNRLFRFSGTRWVKIEDNVRTFTTAGATGNETLRNSFANNTATQTLSNGDVISERQTLSNALRPKADY
jgi:hypothetical protein